MNYREKMHYLMTQHLFEPWDETTQNDIEEEFRRHVPGNYRLCWDKNAESVYLLDEQKDYFHLTFDDPEEEVIWRLRNE